MTQSDQIRRIHLLDSLNNIYCHSMALSVCMDMKENPQACALALSCVETIIADAAELMTLVTDALNKSPPILYFRRRIKAAHCKAKRCPVISLC